MDTAIVCMEPACAPQDYMAASATCVSKDLHIYYLILYNGHNNYDIDTITK